MTSTTKGTLAGRLWTAFVPRPSALRRGSDRAETGACWVALSVLVLCLPFLLAFGSARAQDLRDTATHVRSTSHLVMATVSRVMPRASALGGVPSGAVDVTATWAAANGTVHTTTGVAYRGARVGDPWSAWIDDAGHQVAVPMSDSQATLEGTLVAFWVFMATAVTLTGLLALLGWFLDRRRMRDWDEDWARFCLGRNRGVSG